MEIVNQVVKTNDYSMFNHLDGNRIINKLHVERLKNSFKDRYLMSPIIVNDKHQIIDGQHRFSAAKQLKLPVNYIMVKDYGLKEVQMLNTNNKNWKKEDYLHAYCDLGYDEYLKMRQFMEDFPDFGISASEKILTNTYIGANQKSGPKVDGVSMGKERTFQDGGLFIPNLDLSYENAEKIMMFKTHYDGYNRTLFVSTMITLFKHENYNHAQMIQKCNIQPGALTHCSNTSQYKILIEEIFNYKSHNKVTLRY